MDNAEQRQLRNRVTALDRHRTPLPLLSNGLPSNVSTLDTREIVTITTNITPDIYVANVTTRASLSEHGRARQLDL